jgi:hypothetical protein
MLIGRTAERAAVGEHIRGGHPVVIGGPAGVGKTALFDACLTDLAADGFHVIRIVGVPGGREFALSAVAHLLPDAASLGSHGADSLALAQIISGLVTQPGTGTVVAIDDLPEVDDLSLHAIVTAQDTGRVRVLATARTTTAMPERAAALSRSPGLHIELTSLRRAEVAEVTAGLLDGPIAEGTLERLHQASEGLPLKLTGLVQAALARGGLVQRDGLWHWNARAVVDSRLEILLGLRVESLSEVEHGALETLCIAEQLPVTTVEGVHPGVDLAALERNNTIRALGRPGWLVAGHPLLRDVVLARMTPLRRQLVVRRLLDHWRTHPPTDFDLRRRSVILACEQNEAVDIASVVEWAWWGRQHGAGRLMVAVAERAWSAAPSSRSGLAYADALNQSGRPGEADIVLRAAASHAEDDGMRVTMAIVHADVLRRQTR